MEKSRDLYKRRQARRRRRGNEAAPVVEERRSLHPLLRLQKQVGNAQVSRMLAQREDDLTWIKPEIGPQGGRLSNRLAARIQASRGGGAPLDRARRAQMEDAFGTHLDDVRLHADQEADALNRSISARAFTIGSDIFFRREADPSDPDLLAHELAHVVQQRGMNSDGPLSVGPADDGLEREAQHVAQGRQGVGTMAAPNLTHGAPGGAASVQRGFFDNLLSGITGGGGGGGGGLMGTLGSIGSGISNVVGTITGGGGAADVAGSVGGGISDVGSSVGGRAGDVMGSIGGGVSDVASTIGGGGGVGDIVGSVSSGLGGMLGSLGQGGIGNMISSIGGGLGGMLGGGGGGLGGMLGSLGSGLGGMLGGGGGGLGGMLGSLGGGLGGMLGSLGGGGGILDRLFGR